jgi:drug/metabolite transporter (DMT)-like permease
MALGGYGAVPRTVALTLLALVAFASNSLLTRLALGQRHIDAATFTGIRLGSGALTLVLLVALRSRGLASLRGVRPLEPLALFAYAAPFSFAYLRIGAAAGALILFGVVQLTMMTHGFVRGERPTARAVVGFVLAAFGLGLLTVPAATRPDPLGSALMAGAGVAWGAYSLAGKSAGDPLTATARNFLFSTPLALVLAVICRDSLATDARGAMLAAISGSVTSGLGYAIWYRALPRLSAMQAAVVQLSVPVIAAVGAVLFLGERAGGRLALACAAVLAGVGLVLSTRVRPAK